MDSLVTQGLVGLVFVLSIALWSKSSSSTPSTQSNSTSSSTAKKNKKKKKPVGAGFDNPQATIPLPKTIPTATPKAEQDSPTLVADVPTTKEEVKTAPKVQKSGDKKKGVDAGSKKKMSFRDFSEKTNEERVQELEHEARGDAGERDLGRDMIDKELEPERVYKKVARIEPTIQPKTYAAHSAEQGWENVGGKTKAPTAISNTKVAEAPSNAWASSNPFAALPGSGAELPRSNGKAVKPITSSVTTIVTNTSHSSVPGAGAAQTKKQRQNAAKTQAKKMEKEAMEAERLAKLAQHKRQVENERMKEFYKKQPNSSNPPVSSQWTSVSANPKQKALPKATINEKGSLVWD